MHPPPPLLNLLGPWPYCLSNSTDYWWYWLSSTDCLKLFPQTALATGGPHSIVHTVLIICSPDILSIANMLRLIHRSVWLGSPCSPAEMLTCLALPLPLVFHMGQEAFITSHILAISPSCWPAQTPWCAILLRSITGYFTPTQTSFLISMHNNMFQPYWSDQPNTLTQEIPPPNKKKKCSDPCLSPHLAQPTCSCTSYILYQAVKLSPQMLRPLSWPNCLW